MTATIAIWFAVSLPFAVVVGKLIALRLRSERVAAIAPGPVDYLSAEQLLSRLACQHHADGQPLRKPSARLRQWQDGAMSGTDSDLTALLWALHDMPQTGVTVGAMRIAESHEHLLFDEERQSMMNVAPKRRTEFASGRALLRSLTHLDTPILVGPNRAPAMPSGWQCTIAHDDCFVVGLVSRDPLVTSLGIDIEPFRNLDRAERDIILRPDEPIDAILGFAIKEAVFKAWSGSGGRLIDHHEVRVTLHGNTFNAEVMHGATTFAGEFRSAANRWIAQVVVSSHPSGIDPSRNDVGSKKQ